MIYWRIRQPGKPWQTWSDGTSCDVDAAKVDSISSVLDDNTNQLRPEFANGVNVEMFECEQIDDWQIDQAMVARFRANYLGIKEEK